jgi:adenine-specific DNA-methyltransferase
MINEGRIIFPSDPSGRPREKKYLKDLSSTKTGFSSILDNQDVGFTRNGTKAFADLFEDKYFTFPKSIDLLRVLLQQTTEVNSIVIDLFAGSCSFAEAVFSANSKNGTNVNVISIQVNEPCAENSTAFNAGYYSIAEIGKERIRRAGKKILEGECHGEWNKDIGFRVLKIDSSNMANVYYTPDDAEQENLDLFTDNIKPDRTSEDLLFQVLLDWGVDLSLPIRKETIQDKDIFIVDENALVACFDIGVDEGLVKELAGFEPLRAVFLDNGFESDAVKINVEQIFRQMSPSTEVKSI